MIRDSSHVCKDAAAAAHADSVRAVPRARGRTCESACYHQSCSCRHAHTSIACALCCGCSHLSSRLRDKDHLLYENRTYRVFRPTGASGQYVFLAHAVGADSSAPRQVVRLARRRENEKDARQPAEDCTRCPLYIPAESIAKARVLHNLISGCSLEWLYALPTVVPLRTEVPEPPTGSRSRPWWNRSLHGRFVASRGLVHTEASGYSLIALTRALARSGPSGHAKLLRKLRRSAALLTAAVIDTLIHVRDRSIENVFVEPASGRVMLIDTIDTSLDFRSSLKLNSVMIPATRLFTQYQVGVGDERLLHRVARALDYRCHVPGGAQGAGGVLGDSYPPALRQCLQRVASGEAVARAGRAATFVRLPGGAHGKLSPWRSLPACCYSHTACIPEEIRLRAEELLRLGFERVLARLVGEFANGSATRCQ
jgi:hypothetical protein